MAEGAAKWKQISCRIQSAGCTRRLCNDATAHAVPSPTATACLYLCIVRVAACCEVQAVRLAQRGSTQLGCRLRRAHTRASHDARLHARLLRTLQHTCPVLVEGAVDEIRSNVNRAWPASNHALLYKLPLRRPCACLLRLLLLGLRLLLLLLLLILLLLGVRALLPLLPLLLLLLLKPPLRPGRRRKRWHRLARRRRRHRTAFVSHRSLSRCLQN